MTHTAHHYIVSVPEILGGEPVLEGTRTPVRAVVELWRGGTAAVASYYAPRGDASS